MVSKSEPGKKAGKGVSGRGNSMGKAQRHAIPQQSVQAGLEQFRLTGGDRNSGNETGRHWALSAALG